METRNPHWSEGSPPFDAHTVAEWQTLIDEATLGDEPLLDQLIERYGWNVVWPALDDATRRRRLAKLAASEKRLLLVQLFRRMAEKRERGAGELP